METNTATPPSGASVTKSVSRSHELRVVLGRDLRKPKKKEKEKREKEHQAKNTWKKGKKKTQTSPSHLGSRHASHTFCDTQDRQSRILATAVRTTLELAEFGYFPDDREPYKWTRGCLLDW
jgi:hypothetical protein